MKDFVVVSIFFAFVCLQVMSALSAFNFEGACWLLGFGWMHFGGATCFAEGALMDVKQGGRG